MIEKQLLFDTRILERNLQKGLVTKSQVKVALDRLPDLSGRFETREVSVRQGEFELMPKAVVEVPEEPRLEDEDEDIDD